MDDELRIPGREFPALGYLFLAAIAAVIGLAAIGVGSPGLLPVAASNLIVGSIIVLLAIVVPLTLIRLGSASKNLTHDLHAVKDSARQALAEHEAEQAQELGRFRADLDLEASKGQERGQRLKRLQKDLAKDYGTVQEAVEALQSENAALADRLSASLAGIQAKEHQTKKGFEKTLEEVRSQFQDAEKDIAQNLLATQKAIYESQAEAREETLAALQESLAAYRHAPIGDEDVDRIVGLTLQKVEQRFAALVGRQEKAIDAYRDWMDNQMEAFLHEANQSTEDHRDTPAIGRPSPFGRTYPVDEIEGIGEKTAYRLQAMGVLDTKDLWHADAQHMAAGLGIAATEVRRWQAMAELMALDGIGKQTAEILVACKVGGILQLAQCEVRDLTTRAANADGDHRLQNGAITEKAVARWIKAAKEHKVAPPASSAKAAPAKAKATAEAKVS